MIIADGGYTTHGLNILISFVFKTSISMSIPNMFYS
jgi:hypothetical protein